MTGDDYLPEEGPEDPSSESEQKKKPKKKSGEDLLSPRPKSLGFDIGGETDAPGDDPWERIE